MSRLFIAALLIFGSITCTGIAYAGDTEKQGQMFDRFWAAYGNKDFRRAQEYANEYIESEGKDKRYVVNAWLGVYWIGQIENSLPANRKRPELAIRYLEKAIAEKPDAMLYRMLSDALALHGKEDLANTMLREAANLGDSISVLRLANYAENGIRGNAYNPTAALELLDGWLKREDRDPKAEITILNAKKRLVQKAEKMADIAKSIDIAAMERQGHDGDLSAISKLIGIYHVGRYGIAADEGKYAFWLKVFTANSQKTASGYSALAEAYKTGQGTHVDTMRARRYFELAASIGDVDDRVHLAAFELTHGNRESGKKLSKNLCDQSTKNSWACATLSRIYVEENDFPTALAYAKRSGNEELVRVIKKAFSEREQQMTTPLNDLSSSDSFFSIISISGGKTNIRCLKGLNKGRERQICSNEQGKWSDNCDSLIHYFHHNSFAKAVENACE